MENKIEIPEWVVDRKEYMKYLAYSKHPIMKNTKFEASNGEEIDIAMMPHYLRQRIKSLPPKEQEAFLNYKSEYNSILAKKSVALRKARGTAWKRKSKHQTEEEEKLNVLKKDIVELLGRMFTVNEVVRIMGEDNGIAVTGDFVKKVLRENIVEIERKREEFRNRVADVRLYNKRPRLEELAWLYSKMKLRYVSLGGIEAYNACLRTLEQLRKEAEGDILNVKGAMDVNLNVEINAHIQEEVLKTINLKEIILGRIAARMNYDPLKLITGLHNSYYNKFVQISGDFDEDAEMQYPSLINYDFNEIERRNKEVDDIVDVKAEEVTEDIKVQANSIKDLFLKKIRAQREDMERRTSSYTAAETADDFGLDEGGEKPLNRNFKGRGKDKVPPSVSKAKGRKEKWEE